MNAIDKRALLATLVLATESARHEGGLSLVNIGDQLRRATAVDPLQAVTTTVLVSSALFFAAERGVNEKVKTFGDAVAYCATSLSVGYHDIFPRTEAGKAITGLLHTLGPALAARALDAPAKDIAAKDAASSEHDRAVLGKLEEIANALRARA